MGYNELYSLVGGGLITDDANATASQILSGYTAYVKGKKITGSIQSQNGQTITPMSSIQVIHTKDKYLTGDITVKGDSSLLAGNIRKGATIFGISGTYTSDANATASQILSGYTAYVKGKKITGSIQSQGAQTITPGTTNKTIASGKYLSGTQTIKGDSNLTAGNIKAGTSIFGVSGTFTNDANADGLKIYEGMKVYSKGNAVIGTLPERNVVGRNGALSISSSWPTVALNPYDTNAQFTQTLDKKNYICINVPRGYYNGSSYVGCDPRLFSASKRYEFLGVWGSNRDCLSWALGFLFNINSDYWSVKLIHPFPSGLTPTWRIIAQSSGSTTWSIRINDQEIRSFTSNGYSDFSFNRQINLNDSIGIIPTVNNGGICTLAIYQ